MSSHEPKWWLGEPIWETISNHGFQAATYFWPGSEVKKGSWDCPDKYCAAYNESVPFEERVDTILGYFDLPNDEIPVFMTLYFEDPDHQGHQVGPDDVQVTEAVAKIDGLIGTSDIVNKMNQGLSSGKVKNGDKLKIYLKEDFPERLHYSESDRIPPIIGLVEEGFKVEQKDSKSKECGGAHGYDNAFFSMRTIFIGHGPRFPRGIKVPSFENIEIYNLITSILNINGAPNNGSSSFAKSVLLPHHH